MSAIKAVIFLVSLLVVSQSINAEDICSGEGKARMREANVSEAQIANICPNSAAQDGRSRATKSTASLPLMDMDDLRLDIASLGGRKVRVQGVGHYMMNMFMLKKNTSDMSPMIVDITKLQRDQQRQILQQCADLMTGCRVTVNGTVGKVSYQNGILAENIEW